MFSMGHDTRLHNGKEEILMQLKNFDIVIDSCGFFEVDRRFVSTVCFRFSNNSMLFSHSFPT